MKSANVLTEKRQAVIRIQGDLLKDVKILAIKLDKSFNSLVVEALQDVLKKYKK